MAHGLAVGISSLVLLASCGPGAATTQPVDITGNGLVTGFRGGPDRLGVASGSVASPPSEAWSIDTGDHVIPSPVPVARDVVVVGFDGTLRRVDGTGRSTWEFDLGSAEATPVVAGDVVVAMASSGRLVAVAFTGGGLAWEIDLGARGRSSPTVVGSMVVVGVDTEVVALDVTTGAVRWRADLGAATGSSPAVATPPATTVPASPAAPTGTASPAGSSVARSGIVVIGTADNEVVGLSLADGSRRWSVDLGPAPDGTFIVASGVVSAPALAEETAYVGSTTGRVVALDVSTGAERWRVDVGAPVYASVAVGDEVVHLTTAAGSAMALDRRSGNIVWEVAIGKPSYSSPLLATDGLVVTTEEGIIAGLDPAGGGVLWEVVIGRDGDYMASSPAITDAGVLVVGSNDGRIVALAP